MVLIVPHVFLSSPGLLGLGDIILPGLVIAFLFRYDRQRDPLAPHWQGHFRVAALGYVAGFVVTVLALVLSDGHGQPALLYLVPGVLVPTLLHALHVGDLPQLWHNEHLGGGEALREADNELELTTLATDPATPSDGVALLSPDETRREEQHV